MSWLWGLCSTHSCVTPSTRSLGGDSSCSWRKGKPSRHRKRTVAGTDRAYATLQPKCTGVGSPCAPWVVSASAAVMNVDDVGRFSHWWFSNVSVLGERGRDILFTQGLLYSRVSWVWGSVPHKAQRTLCGGHCVRKRGHSLSRVSTGRKCGVQWGLCQPVSELGALGSSFGPLPPRVFGGGRLSQVRLLPRRAFSAALLTSPG